MKKAILSVFVLLSVQIFAQDNNVQSAADAYKNIVNNYTKNRFREFSDAKKFIDLAASNSETANDPKMWSYRGRIYLEMDRDTSAEVRNLDPDAIEKSVLSFLSCYKADTKQKYLDVCKDNIWISGVRMYNKAVATLNKSDFNQADYEKASRYFSLVAQVFPYDVNEQLKKSTITQDVLTYNQAKAALKAKDNVKAKEYLQTLIDKKYNDPKIYLYMESIYLEERDTVKAMSYIDLGKKQFDSNSSLLGEEIKIYSAQGKIDLLISKFNEAIELYPENEVLYLNRAIAYENKKDYKKAEEDYNKALELKANYLDGNYGLGTMYFNQAVEMMNAANNKSADEFEKAKKEIDLMLKKSATFLEKALDINPKKTADDKATFANTLNTLKKIYARTGETDKYNKVKTAMEAN